MLEEPGVDFDVFQLRSAISSIFFRDDAEIESEREEIELTINLLRTRLEMLPDRGDS
jgi:hypothetical protein